MATIINTAVEAGSFTTLVKAIRAAGLSETLSGPGPFTVFAPTDDAFAKLPPGTIELLLLNPGLLQQILSYHVVVGRYPAADVTRMTSVPTVQGQPITLNTANGVKVNQASVTQTDIEVDNGVIHVIDAVLLPNLPQAVTEETTKTFRQAFNIWATSTEAAVKTTFALQNAAIETSLAFADLTGNGNRAFFMPWVNVVRQAQATTLEVWQATTRAVR